MNNANRQYAADLGVVIDRRQFDDGETFYLRVKRGDLPGYNGPYTTRLTFRYGDNEALFEHIVKQWLDTVPWPTEDDPRVVEKGVNL